jgi:hypothetical protein
MHVVATSMIYVLCGIFFMVCSRYVNMLLKINIKVEDGCGKHESGLGNPLNLTWQFGLMFDKLWDKWACIFEAYKMEALTCFPPKNNQDDFVLNKYKYTTKWLICAIYKNWERK